MFSGSKFTGSQNPGLPASVVVALERGFGKYCNSCKSRRVNEGGWEGGRLGGEALVCVQAGGRYGLKEPSLGALLVLYFAVSGAFLRLCASAKDGQRKEG